MNLHLHFGQGQAATSAFTDALPLLRLPDSELRPSVSLCQPLGKTPELQGSCEQSGVLNGDAFDDPGLPGTQGGAAARRRENPEVSVFLLSFQPLEECPSLGVGLYPGSSSAEFSKRWAFLSKVFVWSASPTDCLYTRGESLPAS